MKIWQVWEYDYEGSYVVAIYDSEALAKDHAETFGLTYEPAEVLSELTPEAADPILREQRAQQRELGAEKNRRVAEEQLERLRRDQEWRQNATIDQHPRTGLCHCQTFMGATYDKSITPHGYCTYCGGWTPTVYRAFHGDSALVREIDKLALNYRIAMRTICNLPDSEIAHSTARGE